MTTSLIPSNGLPSSSDCSQNRASLIWRVWRQLRRAFFAASDEHRAVRYRWCELLCRRFFDIYLPEDRKLWLQDTQFLSLHDRFEPRSRRAAERAYMLRELLKLVCNVPGDTAECGVYRGKTSYFICETAQRRHHLFDSFEGLSGPSIEDGTTDPKAHCWKKGDLAVSEQVTRSALNEFADIHFHKGWIPDQFEAVADRPFCFIHIDVDLYQPTRDSLDFFYPRLSPGGIIVCDDYGFTTCPGAKRACDEFIADRPESLIHCPTGQAFIIKNR